jgi:hypothetical protein
VSEESLTHDLRFRIGDAFPSDESLARWLTACCMAANDLVYLNQQLFPRLQGDDAPAFENLYLSRLVASHLYEVAKFLIQAERRYGADLQPFLDRLPASARSDYEAVKAIGPGGQNPLAEPLERLRNHFFHYAELIPQAPQYEQLARALDAHASSTSAIRWGDHLIDFRADFADDIAAELSFPGDTGVHDFVAGFAEATPAYVRFTHAALAQYLVDQGLMSERSRS